MEASKIIENKTLIVITHRLRTEEIQIESLLCIKEG